MTKLTLYHYTTEENEKAIKKAGHIKPSTGKQRDAMFGVGVYLTDVAPSACSSKEELAQKLWLGGAKSRLDQGYMDACIKVYVHVDMVQMMDEVRRIWLYPYDYPLEIDPDFSWGWTAVGVGAGIAALAGIGLGIGLLAKSLMSDDSKKEKKNREQQSSWW